MSFDTDPLQQDLQAGYQARKQWYGRGRFQDHSEIFAIETGRAGVAAGSRLLEIGFGEGHFLDWARQEGHEICGVEINPDFYHLARDRGHRVYLGKAPDVLAREAGPFDGIFMFDVLEHLTLPEIRDLFCFLKTVLAGPGRILVRTPNGASPFGRYLQYGDATHKTVVTGPLLTDLACVSGLTVQGVMNGARTLRTGMHRNYVAKRLAYTFRDLVQGIIGYVYYGHNVPLDPNLTVILGHDPA